MIPLDKQLASTSIVKLHDDGVELIVCRMTMQYQVNRFRSAKTLEAQCDWISYYLGHPVDPERVISLEEHQVPNTINKANQPVIDLVVKVKKGERVLVDWLKRCGKGEYTLHISENDDLTISFPGIVNPLTLNLGVL